MFVDTADLSAEVESFIDTGVIVFFRSAVITSRMELDGTAVGQAGL